MKLHNFSPLVDTADCRTIQKPHTEEAQAQTQARPRAVAPLWWWY